MAACALVSPCGRVELLNDANLNFNDVLQKPVHSLCVKGFTLFFSSAAFFTSEVNEFASGLANQLIKGDACLVHDQQQQLLQCLLQSKHLRIAQEFSPCTPGSSPCTNSHAVLLLPAEPGSTSHSHWDSSSNSSMDAASCCDSSSSCFLKRPRSLQHIAAANSTRQRLLRSMSAAGAGAPLSAAAPAPMAAADATSLPPGGAGSTATANAVAATATAPAAVCTSSSSCCPQYSSCHRRMPVAAAKGNLCTPCRNSSSSIPFYDSYSSSLGAVEPVTPNSRTEAAVSGPLQQCSSTDSKTQEACDDAQPMDVDPTPHQQQQQQQSLHPSHLLHSVTAGAEEHPTASSAAAAAEAATTMQSGVLAHTEGGVQAAAALSEPPDAPASSAAAAAAAAAAVALPVWIDLPVEVIAQVARFTGNTVAAVMPICMTCRSWRQAVLEDDQLLSGLTFKLNTPPHHCSSRGHRARLQHPVLLERASKLGNVSALVVRARLLDAAGAPDEAMRCWRRAAKAGHLEGQLLYGLALYRGTAGVAPDAEDAHLWLSKALKQVLAVKQPSSNAGSGSNGSSNGTGSSAQGAAEGCSSNVSPVPSNCMAAAAAAASSRQLCGLQCRVLTQAGLVLGYLSFDGEGTRIDNQEAVRCFKLAAAAGCKEAQQVLGWIFNTGQY